MRLFKGQRFRIYEGRIVTEEQALENLSQMGRAGEQQAVEIWYLGYSHSSIEVVSILDNDGTESAPKAHNAQELYDGWNKMEGAITWDVRPVRTTNNIISTNG